MKFEKDHSIEEYILSKVIFPKSTEETIAHFPSGLIGCLRSRYYNWMSREELEEEFGDILSQEPDEIDEDWLRMQSIFQMGNHVEDGLKDWLNMAGLLPHPNRCQFRIRSRKYLISGNCDFNIYKDRMDIPIECKSSKQERYNGWGGWYCVNCDQKLWKTAKFCKGCGCREGNLSLEHRWTTKGYAIEPDLSHYAQLQSYLNIGEYAGQIPGEQFGYLYYYNKNTSETTWWKVTQDVEFWNEIIERTDELMDAVKLRTPPEREFKAKFDINGAIKDSSDWHCKWCGFWRICHADIIREHLSEREKEIARLFGLE